MTWPLPAPDEIADRAAGVFEGAVEGIDARSEHAVAAVLCRITGMSVFDAYLYLQRNATELMPDTAIDWLPRHAAIWNVPRVQPSFAAGAATFSATVVTDVPIGFALSAPGSVVVTTTADVIVPAGGSADIPVQATIAGSGGNLVAGVVLTAVSPLAGLSPQTAAVTGAGLSGGNEIEDIEVWRGRILERIRETPMGGADADYRAWVRQVYPAAIVQVIGAWVGLGTVGVVVAMPGPRVPTTDELAAVDAHLQAVRPVTARVITLAASLHPVDVHLTLNPDTVSIRAAAGTGLALFFLQDATIGGAIYVSRLDDAVSSASGEYSHERIAPAADVAMGATEMPTLGTVTFG